MDFTSDDTNFNDMYSSATGSSASLESMNYSMTSQQLYDALQTFLPPTTPFSDGTPSSTMLSPVVPPTTSSSLTITMLRETAPIWFRIVGIAQDIFIADIFVTTRSGWANINILARMAYEALSEAYNLYISQWGIPQPEEAHTIEDSRIVKLVIKEFNDIRTALKKQAQLLVAPRSNLEASNLVASYNVPTNPTTNVSANVMYWLQDDRYLHSGATDAAGRLVEDFANPVIMQLIYHAWYFGVAGWPKHSVAQGCKTLWGLNAAFSTVPYDCIAMAGAAVTNAFHQMQPGHFVKKNFNEAPYANVVQAIRDKIHNQCMDPQFKATFDQYLTNMAIRFMGGMS